MIHHPDAMQKYADIRAELERVDGRAKVARPIYLSAIATGEGGMSDQRRASRPAGWLRGWRSQ